MNEPTTPLSPRLSLSFEQAVPDPSRPIAVELVFTAPDPPRQAAAQLPLNLGVAIDRSGSMAGQKLDAARRAAAGVLEALGEGERFAAAAFDDSVIDVSPSMVLGDETRARIASRIAGLVPGGSTALFDGFARTAELVAAGGSASQTDSCVVVLSDGMGNHGLTDPASMRTHAASLADRGIRTITIGIGEDYEAAQLTALSDGGAGEFHHASLPDEIVEILMGELRTLRSISIRELTVSVRLPDEGKWMLLGGDTKQKGAKGIARFERVVDGRSVRVVAMLWPSPDGAPALADSASPRLSAKAEWMDRDGERHKASFAPSSGAPKERDIGLAVRAARLWHARIVARALELNERGEFDQAESWVKRSRREFASYVSGLPDMTDLVESLRAMAHRVGREWRTLGRRESYVMARKAMYSMPDVREAAPASYLEALEVDRKKR